MVYMLDMRTVYKILCGSRKTAIVKDEEIYTKYARLWNATLFVLLSITFSN